MKEKAIATLILGQEYQRCFNMYFLPGWEFYCRKHDIDLVVFEEPLDTSPRAVGRSPAWQKCLIPNSPKLKDYAQVAWIDADIKIRPNSPDIFDNVEIDKVGAVNSFATPTHEDHYMALERLYRKWDLQSVKYVRNLTPKEYHENFGLQGHWDGVVQTGVIVFSPRYHFQLFQRTYENYEDKGGPSWNYEMRPLSHELLSSGCIQWISPKFNMVWDFYREHFYPFLNTKNLSLRMQRALEKLSIAAFSNLKKQCLNTAFRNNYFLHFASRSKDYRFINDKTHF